MSKSKYEILGIDYQINPTANVKNLVKQFTDGRLIYRARYVKSDISLIDTINNRFTIYNAKLDDEYTFILSSDFDIYIKGIRLSSDIYRIEQSGENVVITFNENELDYNTFSLSDVVVFGKFSEINVNEVSVYLVTEQGDYLITDDNNYIII
jgi:hypothetical protein